MSSEMSEQTILVKTEEAAATAASAAGSIAVEGERTCPLGDRHIHRDDVRQVWKECQEESFWYRALPLSVGSMAVTGGLIYNGIWKSSQRFGPFPKLVVAGILGYAVGKASYAGTCRSKFQRLGPIFGPESGKEFGLGFGGRIFGPGRRHCHHVCEECKKQQAQTAPAEKA